MGRREIGVCVVLLAFGCASRTGSPTSTQRPTSATSANEAVEAEADEDQPQPLPEGFDLDAALTQAEMIGAALYRHDKLVWWGSDALFADPGFPRGVPMGGWTVDIQEEGQVHFFSRSDEGVRRIATVECESSGPKSCVVKLVTPPAAPTPEQSVILRARRTAYESPKFVRKTERYNDVVLRGQTYGHGDSWLVYMLAASPDAYVMMLGGHYRFIISADGSEVESVRELSTSLIAMPKQKNSVAAVVSHVLDPVPIESHVWASLMYAQPLFVATSTGMYEVDGGKISTSASASGPISPQ